MKYQVWDKNFFHGIHDPYSRVPYFEKVDSKARKFLFLRHILATTYRTTLDCSRQAGLDTGHLPRSEFSKSVAFPPYYICTLSITP